MHILVLTFHNILVPRYGGALRTSQLLRQLLARGHCVSAIRFRLAGDEPSPEDAGVPVRDVIVPPGYPLAPLAALTHLFSPQATRFALAFNREQRVDLLQSDPPWTALTGARLARKLHVPHILLSQNCESALAAHFARITLAHRIPVIGHPVADFNKAVLQWAEKHVITRAALTLTPSMQDRNEMAAFGIPVERVEILPNGTHMCVLPASTRLEVRRRLGLDDAPIVVFVGRLDYPPNAEAARVICNHIAPCCPSVVFLLIGMDPPQIVPPPNVRVMGFVEEVDRYLSASDLSIVPITFGSGTRIKILDAWAVGLPVISTSAAISGLEYENGVNVVIEDDLEQFSERIRELLASPTRLSDLRQGALEAAKPYRWEAIGQQYVKRLEALVHK